MDPLGKEALSDTAEKMPVGIVISDARYPGQPITYVNEAFERITRFSREFAIGRDCSFLHGPETEKEAVDRILEGLRGDVDFEVTLTHHKADGTPFRNQVLGVPVPGSDGRAASFFCVLRDVTGTYDQQSESDHLMDLLRELQHRVKNHLGMVVSMIRIQASRPITPDSFAAISRRIEALGLLYEELFDASTNGQGPAETIHAGAYLTRIATVISRLEGRDGIRVDIDCEDMTLPVDQAGRLGLLLSELLTNAIEHGFDGRDTGTIRVRCHRNGGGAVRLSVEDDGVGLPPGSNWPHAAPSIAAQSDAAREDEGQLDTTGVGGHSGVGGSIVEALTQSLGARLEVGSADPGTRVWVEFDADT